jgi:DMSO/TMAO reductase YedYZ molybdopterin-dependent catalytic subunit
MRPPPGPTRPEFWRSPVRSVRLTAILGLTLLAGLPVVILTGLLSQAAYEPELGRNDFVGAPSPFDLSWVGWPTSPPWLYALNQGAHVTIGIALVPIVLAKLWSVIPKLFEWPPVRSPAHGLERLSLALLVGGILFQLVTGIFNIQLYYPWHFSFLQAHYWGAWVFTGAFAVHVALKLPTAVRSVRTREEVMSAVAPAEPTISRRGLLALVGSGSAALLLMTAGQSIGGPLRRLALLAPHGRDLGDGPNDFQINKTAAAVGIDPRATGAAWRLEVRGAGRTVRLSRTQLLALPQHAYDLPIACVEGWSTTQRWSGVRIADLARLAGAAAGDDVLVESLQPRGSFRRAALSAGQARDDRSLLALRVNGADLSLDHGFPARVIVPALPGVHCTKWVRRMTFGPLA